jgi:branched-chain amino acid transport system substrate-binding protein
MPISRRHLVGTAVVSALLPAGWTRTARASETPIRIGILNDQSGVYADFGGKWSVAAAKLAAEDFGGQVLGRPVEILDADHQNKPDLASNIARKWYDNDHVDAIMELTTSSVALAVQALSKEKQKINIVTAAATTDLTGKQCSPYGFHWAYDTHSQAVGTGGALVEHGGKSWFFITVDYAFGHSLQEQTSKFVMAKGGAVVGSVLYPLGTTDYSAYLLRAKASKAQVVGLANAGIATGGQKIATLLLTLAEVQGLGLQAAQGAVLTEAYYWDLNDRMRDLGQRFMKRTGRMPSMIQAGTYSAVLQYLKAVRAAESAATEAVAKQLHALPVDDAFVQGGKVLANGSMAHDMYLFEVKTPQESKGQAVGDSPRR